MNHHYETEVKFINQKLIDTFGYSFDNKPLYRVSWSEDQFEKRLTPFTDEGFPLIHPEVRLLPKYRQWIQNKYIIEKLAIVPPNSEVKEKLSYEPLYVFEDGNGLALPLKWEVCLIVIDSVHRAMNETYGTKYKQSEEDIKRIDEAEYNKIHHMLYGNDTNVTDALHYKEGVSLSGAYKNVENTDN